MGYADLLPPSPPGSRQIRSVDKSTVPSWDKVRRPVTGFGGSSDWFSRSRSSQQVASYSPDDRSAEVADTQGRCTADWRPLTGRAGLRATIIRVGALVSCWRWFLGRSGFSRLSRLQIYLVVVEVESFIWCRSTHRGSMLLACHGGIWMVLYSCIHLPV